MKKKLKQECVCSFPSVREQHRQTTEDSLSYRSIELSNEI